MTRKHHFNIIDFLIFSIFDRYIGSIPKILSDIYFSLGTQIPDELALVLPSDGEDSFTREGKTPMYCQPSMSRVPSVTQVANEEDQLEELRTRSAKKRRFDPVLDHILFCFSHFYFAFSL